MKKTLRQRIARAFDWLTSERKIALSRRARSKLAKTRSTTAAVTAA